MIMGRYIRGNQEEEPPIYSNEGPFVWEGERLKSFIYNGSCYPVEYSGSWAYITVNERVLTLNIQPGIDAFLEKDPSASLEA